jgi:hypothetical protein
MTIEVYRRYKRPFHPGPATADGILCLLKVQQLNLLILLQVLSRKAENCKIGHRGTRLVLL